MYKKTLEDIKNYILNDNEKLSYFEVLKLLFRVCIIIYLPISFIILMLCLLKTIFY